MATMALARFGCGCETFEDTPAQDAALPACTCEVGFCSADGVCQCPDENGDPVSCQVVAQAPTQPPPPLSL